MDLFLYKQGVLRVRKRVTLMAVTVTAIFGICWAPDVIVHNLGSNASLSISEDVYAVTHTLILFSSAVNPFVYALVNTNFRGKLKGILCCSCTTSTGSTRTRVFPQHLTSMAGTSSLESSKIKNISSFNAAFLWLKENATALYRLKR